MKIRRILIAALAALTLLCCAGCGEKRQAGFDVLERLGTEQFSVAFRKDDPLCDYMTAAMQETAAEGTIARLSSMYLGADYSCMEGKANAIVMLGMEIPADRIVTVGVIDGAAPLCYRDDSGNFTGMIPDLAGLVTEKLGWQLRYHQINIEDVTVELNSGNIDCAWVPAAYASSSSYSLSPVWMENAHLLIVRHGSGINRVKDLKNHNIGLTDNTALKAFRENTKIGDSVTVWTYSDIRSCFSALAAGDCDAIVIDDIVSSHYLNG